MPVIGHDNYDGTKQIVAKPPFKLIEDGDTILHPKTTGLLSESGSVPVDAASLAALEANLRSLSSSDPDPRIRAAAARVGLHVRLSLAPTPVLSYVCGKKFKVLNASDFTFDVGYEVVGSTETGSLILYPRHDSSTPSEAFFETDNVGTVRLLSSAGDLIGTAANLKQACAS